MRQYFQLAFAFLALAACDPIVDNRGFVDENVALDELIPGVHQREDVARVMGTPSAISKYEDSIWYYIHLRKESEAFFKPEITEQKVTRVTFNANGSLDKIEAVSDLEPQQVEYVSKETPTEGQELGFFEQILGNVGRFGAPGRRTPGAGTPGPGGR